METLQIVRILEKRNFDQDEAIQLAEAINGKSGLATKEDIAEIRAEFKADIASVKEDIAEVRAEFKADIARLETNITEVRAEFKADITSVKKDITRLEGKIERVEAEIKGEVKTLATAVKINLALTVGLYIGIAVYFLTN